MAEIINTVMELLINDADNSTDFQGMVLEYLIDITHGALDSDFDNFTIISKEPLKVADRLWLVRVQVGDQGA